MSAGEVEGLNLGSEAAVEALVERVRLKGPIAAIVHLLPLRGDAAIRPSIPRRGRPGWAPELRGLYLLARAAADDLATSARRGGSAVIAATAMGGSFASAGAAVDFFPGQGGIAGLVKTLAREWPDVRARAVDFDPIGTTEVIAADLVREVLVDDGRAEVGYPGGRRATLQVVPSPLGCVAAGPGFAVEPGEPILVTGGARGITAAVGAGPGDAMAADAPARRQHPDARCSGGRRGPRASPGLRP